MIILLPLLRHLSVRARMAVGSMLTGVGLVLVVIAVAAARELFIFAIITALVGVVFLVSASRGRRRERLGSLIG